jgi:transcription termination factor Rho
MALPPKTDDDSSSSANAASSAPKKTKRAAAAPRARKPKASKAKASNANAELSFEQSAPVPSSRENDSAPAAVFVPKPAVSAPPSQSSSDFGSSDQPTSYSSDNDSGANSDQGSGQSDHAQGGSSQPQDHQSGGQQGGGWNQGNQVGGGQGGQQQGGQPSHGGQGGGRGEWQGRDSWKRNKRKRGRNGGAPWQPNAPGGGNGGGGGGGNAPFYPPQPPPPSSPQVFGDLPNPARFTNLAGLDALAAEISSGGGQPVVLDDLYTLTLAELTAFARREGIVVEGAPNRRTLQAQIFTAAAAAKCPIIDRGYIDITDRGAFIVHSQGNYRLYPDDAYLPESLVNRYGLKRGHQVEVLVQAPQPGDRCPAVVRIDKVMGLAPEAIADVVPFEELVPYYPLKRILLEDEEVVKDVSMRAIDILTPIGFGQRGLIVAPPRTGKTVLLQNIANSISANSPDVKLILLLIDERPEEVTDFKRHTKGEVVSSTFDETPESHVHCAEMVGEKARRLVEQGQHVVILLDSITRLARAYNALTGNGGKTMSGGLESNALQKPKRFFGAARNIEGAGSLTIIATALVDTGSRMDEIIFEEFKGTGNCEIHLDRGLVERRIFPAINIDRSGTRKEELIYHPEELQRIYGLRRAMQGLGPIESMEMLITRLKKTKSNAEFLLSLSRQ